VIPIDDRGLLLGDGLYETALAQDGRLVWWRQHVERMIAGCHTLGLPPPEPETLEAAALAAIDGRTERLAVRVTWTAGSGLRGMVRPEPMTPRLFASASPAPKSSDPISLVVSDVRRNEGSPASRLKTLAYLDNVIARTRARARGADDAVMLNNRGEVACVTAANIFWIKGGVLATPAIQCGALAGVAGIHVMTAARRMGVETQVLAAPVEALLGAEAVFLTNSLIGVRPVPRIEDVYFQPHALVAALGDALWAGL
jgi:branched-chain amino acid aminotransferase/4-amino-4-deoxychorismate lyase